MWTHLRKPGEPLDMLIELPDALRNVLDIWRAVQVH